MRIPDRLASLVEHGVIDEVARSLKSGKEADVFVVASGGEWRVAKVYKEAQNRNFQNRAEYMEGRQVRSSRDQRAMAKGSKYGKAQNEEAWQSAEVDMIYRLQGAGIRVPKPFYFIDGVLIMELVANADGEPAPRLGDLEFTPEEAQEVFGQLVAEVARMLSAGVVHGDLSDFNVLMAADGPVVIDFPQSVNAASNTNARKMLLRDVDNLHRFLQRFVPGAPRLPYAEEMWELYEKGELTADSQLTGTYVDTRKSSGTREVLGLIDDARRDEQKKREYSGRSLRGMGPSERGARPGGQARPHGAPHQARPGAQPPRQARPNLQHPNQGRPDSQHPNQARPHSQHPNQARPHSQHPNQARPHSQHPNQARPDSQHPNQARPHSQHPNQARPDSQHPNQARPHAQHPNQARPHSQHPNQARPHAQQQSRAHAPAAEEKSGTAAPPDREPSS